MAKAIMVVGTSSGVGKSVLCTALCRLLQQDGRRVAPFKAQNMSLNSAITPSGREIGRAQAVQAEACRIAPNEHMNPVLLKPTSARASQVVVQGRVLGTQTDFADGTDGLEYLWSRVEESFRLLADEFDVIVIEGAGSPVEMNLKARDIANMRTAALADADVVLVADIDRGGVFAYVYGTIALLTPEERGRVKGVVINKFRGDPALFEDGKRLLESYTGIPVIGVIPYLGDLEIDEEDSVALAGPRYRGERSEDAQTLRIRVVALPYMSNFNDFDPLFAEPAVSVQFCRHVREAADAHVVILPGTKNTLLDLQWMKATGWFDAIASSHGRGTHIVGVCGGYQMLGREVADPDGIESANGEILRGLGLLPVRTVWHSEKTTVLVDGIATLPEGEVPIRGYEIHMGVSTYVEGATPFARVRADSDTKWRVDGAIADGGRVIGTYVHGLFDHDVFRTAWLDMVRTAHGLSRPAGEVAPVPYQARREANYDRLANLLREHVDLSVLSI
ncbi:cobyric acid synthase [Alicyclobacillus acidiphilus]|uniref:cobyric acid synthase n=1 Tax=Alicyclobacillus acidiphilus TaxID=182455 RepID=UPI0008369745|nr:cobyric acid synthase [Alicyclobacillus acidiphilus]